MRAVWINRYEAGADPKLSQPDYQIKNLLELPRVLAGEPATPV